MSRLKSYSFPAFFACYLLKSARTSRSFKNYIGFTRDPVLRLQQHNGNRWGGAQETEQHRPWAMQLLVHGFPSPPAALLFEYAWRNPHKSRYTRDEADVHIYGESGITVGHNIMILQTMIRLFPFSKWPLHVKLFTEEAACYWVALASTPPSSQYYVASSNDKSRQFGDELMNEQAHKNSEMLFPPGFTFTIELNSVSGSRKLPRSRLKDQFTGPYLAKTKALITSRRRSRCSICAKPVKNLANDHLGTTICTHEDCTSVAHLQCLAKSWLDVERSLCSKPTSFSSNLSSSPSAHPPSVSSDHSLVDLPASAMSASPISTLSSALSSTRLPPSSSALPASLTGVSATQSLHNGTQNPPPNPHQQLSIPNLSGLGEGMFPRGGICNSCGTYTLWGDIIKGCFTRGTGGKALKRRSKLSPQTNESASEECSDSGAGSVWPTQFDVLTLREVSAKRKRRVTSVIYQSGKPPRKARVLAQKAQFDLARKVVDRYRHIIRRKQASIAKRYILALMDPPSRLGRPRKITVSTTTTATTATAVIPLKKRGPRKSKKTLLQESPATNAPLKTLARVKAKKS